MGGSTLINGMIYVRGQPADYDGWEAAGAAGWNWAQAERLFRKIECYEKGGAGRGHDGPCACMKSRNAIRWPRPS